MPFSWPIAKIDYLHLAIIAMTAMATCEGEEAQFLANRKAPSQRRRRRIDDLNVFWQDLNTGISAWKSRLEELTEKRQHVTSSQRAEGLAAIEELEKELQNLRKRSLADLDVPELPAADVRQLHNEFTNLSNLLETARNNICPPSRFVFKRYREAMQNRETRQAGEKCEHVEGTAKIEEEKEVHAQVQHLGAVVQEISNCTILIDGNGGLTITGSKAGLSPGQSLLTDSASLLIQNIAQCEVTVLRPYKALHIVNVSDCTVRITPPVLGAVHVTSCHRLNLQMSSHQLRLHDSTYLHCYASVGSGPILEDCNNIVFHYDPADKKNQIRDAKDFNWLKNGVQSPNYTILECQPRMQIDNGSVAHDHLSTSNAKIITSNTNNIVAVDHGLTLESGSDSDDEL